MTQVRPSAENNFRPEFHEHPRGESRLIEDSQFCYCELTGREQLT